MFLYNGRGSWSVKTVYCIQQYHDRYDTVPVPIRIIIQLIEKGSRHSLRHSVVVSAENAETGFIRMESVRVCVCGMEYKMYCAHIRAPANAVTFT